MPKTSLYKETLSEMLQVENSQVSQIATGGKLQDWFAIAPAEFMKRRDISPTAKWVWCAMLMHSLGSNRVAMSHHAIAEACGSSRAQVLRCLRDLVGVGLIEAAGPPEHQVQPYRILQARCRLVAQPVPAAPAHPAKPLLTCGKCHKPARGLMNTGWCRSCASEMKVRRIVRDELRATA